MNRYIHLLAAALIAASLLSACDGKDKPKEEPITLSVNPTAVTFDAKASSAQAVSVVTKATWSASSSQSWLTISPANGTGNGMISLNASVNDGSSSRTATVTVKDSEGKLSATVQVTQEASSVKTLVANPKAFDGNKRSDLTYQLLIYSFKDGVRNDGVGDFKGIEQKLDYLDDLGVTALWLSPAHPTSSYHAYDVNDYGKLNPLYSTSNTTESAEADFKSLIDAAHAKGIKIYMDYVLNHSGKDNEWFKDVLSNENSPYRDYYVISDDPNTDIAAGKIDNYAGAKDPGMGTWHPFTIGERGYTGKLHFKLDWTGSTKKITVTKSTDEAQKSNSSATKWLWIGKNATSVGMYETSTNIFEITLDVDTDWGFLVRTSSSSWNAGTKWGAPAGAGPLVFGQPFNLASNSGSDPGDITFGGKTSYYFASFDASMPDLNYGKYTDAANSPAFKDIATTAEHWLELGVDGFRLDAVIWIYQAQIAANQAFLSAWYDRLNAKYHNLGKDGDIFMVAEAWEGHSTEKQYYKGLISNFEFEYWGALGNALRNRNASSYVNSVMMYNKDHRAVRPDAITSIFMTNHDQNRAANDINKNVTLEKQAAAMLLTSEGKPFVYQGEELGYWGTKDNGDEYVRTPILWDKAGKDLAKNGVNGKVDNTMLTASISVEAQAADANSLLNVYKTFSRLRNTYPALATGAMSKVSYINDSALAAWYMTATDGSKMLVIHNVAGTDKTFNVDDSMEKVAGLLGTATADGKKLTLGANSSVVFEL